MCLPNLRNLRPPLLRYLLFLSDRSPHSAACDAYLQDRGAYACTPARVRMDAYRTIIHATGLLPFQFTVISTFSLGPLGQCGRDRKTKMGTGKHGDKRGKCAQKNRNQGCADGTLIDRRLGNCNFPATFLRISRAPCIITIYTYNMITYGPTFI